MLLKNHMTNTFIRSNQMFQAGADPIKDSNVQRTPLHEACIGGHTLVVKELLKHMTDINVVDSNGQTSAHLAAYHGESECLEILITNGSNMVLEDKQGRTPAHLAAMKNHRAALRYSIIFMYDWAPNEILSPKGHVTGVKS